ncbi:MAG: hypothetical protein JWM11_5233 [Planctomycetaceae bacterium]|nr:hypothetical protein [Planctomycetaceae bacterium]
MKRLAKWNSQEAWSSMTGRGTYLFLNLPRGGVGSQRPERDVWVGPF